MFPSIPTIHKQQSSKLSNSLLLQLLGYEMCWFHNIISIPEKYTAILGKQLHFVVQNPRWPPKYMIDDIVAQNG